jgi:hypothetical protein
MLHKSTLAAIFLTCAVGAAHATPPQVVSVEDILLGANDTHIFLLRSLDDNMGGYVQTQTDILLVARNRSTNADDEIWPVARSIANSPFEDASSEGRVQAIALDGAVNPFDVLAERGAELMVGRSQDARSFADIAITADGDRLVVVDTRAEQQYQIGYGEVGQLIVDNLNRSRATLPAYFAEMGYDVLEDTRFDVQADCVFSASFGLIDTEQQVARMVAVTCQNDQTMAPVSTYFMVPPAG